MAAACRGAASAGGHDGRASSPAPTAREANEWVEVAIPTGLGELRNGLVVRAADAVVAVGGAYGTLSEIALALKSGRRRSSGSTPGRSTGVELRRHARRGGGAGARARRRRRAA